LLKRNTQSSEIKSVKTKYEFQATTFAGTLKLTDRASWITIRRGQWLVVIALAVLAFLMRRKGLATQSLWFDEADLVSRATQDLSVILKSFFKPGENGPLYTLFMHFWIQVAGTGEAAVRTPSMLAGTAAVPLIFLVGRKLGGIMLGLTGAFLLTVSPYLLWYSQDAKMYPLALCITLASVYLFLRGLESDKKGWWIAYVIITTLGFYIHLMTVLIVGVELVFFFLSQKSEVRSQKVQADVQSSESRVQSPKYSALSTQHSALNPSQSLIRRRALISLGLLTLPYLPIAVWQLIALRDGTVGNGWQQPVGLLDMLNTLVRRFGVNRSIEPWESLGALVFVGLALLGLVAAWLGWGRSAKASRPAALFLTIYFLLPILAFYVLSMRIPLFADRYLLIASPAYYLLAGWGLLWLIGRFWPVALALLAVALICMVVALQSFNYSNTPQKEDWREAMHWLNERVRPGDEIFVIPGYLDSAIKYYFKPGFDVPIYTIPGDLLDDHDDVQLNDFLQKAVKGKERAWLVVSPERYTQEDKKQFVRTGWFDYNTWMFSDPEVKVGVTIYGYTFKLIPGTDKEFYPRTGETSYTFGDSLRLEGYNYSPKIPGETGNVVQYGDYLHLTMFWRKLTQDQTSYTMSVRLLDKDGHDTGTNYTALPLNGYLSSSQWRKNEAVRDYRDLFIHVPPGEYKLEVTVYSAGNPQALLNVNGSELGGSNVQGATKILLDKPILVK
jgi:hypothetical protein